MTSDFPPESHLEACYSGQLIVASSASHCKQMETVQALLGHHIVHSHSIPKTFLSSLGSDTSPALPEDRYCCPSSPWQVQKWCLRDVSSLQSRGCTEKTMICGCRKNSLQRLPSWFGCSANHGNWLRLYSTPMYPGTQKSCDISNWGFYKETRPQIQWKHFKMLLELHFLDIN